MKQRIPNSKILCCASIFALSLAACSNHPKVNPDANLADNGANGTANHIVKLKKGHRSKKLGLPLPDPRSYDNLWDRLFDRFDLPAVSHQEVDRELNWFINHPTYIERVQSRAEPFLYSIVKQLEKQNMPGELALLPVIESAFQPHVVSPAHAAGIWQFIPATGRHYGLKQSHSYDGRRDIYASTHAAIKYLKKLHNDFNGDWLLAVAGYNCGEGAVARAIQRNNARGLPTDFWSLDLPQETRTYVPRLLAVAKLFSESEQYGFSLRPIPNKALYKTVKMNNQVDLALAANAADISLDKLFELNPGFKRQQVDLDGSYRLFIPAHKKIVDFKEDLARQMAAGQGYDMTENPSSSRRSSLKSAANSIIEAQAPALKERPVPVEIKPAVPVEQAPEPEPAAVAPQSYAPVEQVPAPAETPTPPVQNSEAVAETAPVLPEPAPELSGESFAPVNMAGSSGIRTRAEDEPRETSRISHSPGQNRLVTASLEPSPKVADYERISTGSAKERLLASKQLTKTGLKSQEEPLVIERNKGKEHESPNVDLHEHGLSAKGKQKETLKEHEFLASERHQPELESPSKKAAYRVQEGDTLYSIARKHDMDVDDLKKMNHIAQADDINYGQTLVVPGKDLGKKLPAGKGVVAAKPVQSTKYTAHDGETLFSISRRFNVTVADLRKWNGIKEDRQFRAGMNITVSGEKD